MRVRTETASAGMPTARYTSKSTRVELMHESSRNRRRSAAFATPRSERRSKTCDARSATAASQVVFGCSCHAGLNCQWMRQVRWCQLFGAGRFEWGEPLEPPLTSRVCGLTVCRHKVSLSGDGEMRSSPPQQSCQMVSDNEKR